MFKKRCKASFSFLKIVLNALIVTSFSFDAPVVSLNLFPCSVAHLFISSTSAVL